MQGREGAGGEEDDREQLEELLNRVFRDPASRWGFTSEREKIVWVLGKLARGLTARAGASLREARSKQRESKEASKDGGAAGQGGR